MKKLLVLALVLSVVGLANAGLRIAVNGEVPTTGEITLSPSDTVVLSLVASGGQLGGGYIMDSGGPGMINIQNAVQNVFAGQSAEAYVIDISDGTAGKQSILFDLLIPGSVVNVLPTIPVDGMVFHCAGPQDVIITLLDSGVGQFTDTLVIHQSIPEPMTMLLLGLGGLFLRKK